MKRTYPANIDGQIFYIDEDAFNLLQDYLSKLKMTFTGSEGDEIVSDIESRIRELFNEKNAGGTGVIVLTDVRKVIETMGSPEDLSEESEKEDCDKTEQTKTTVNDSKPFISLNLPTSKKLYRNTKDKVFGGVFGGLAKYLNWNANIMRLLYIIITCSLFGTDISFLPVLIYLIAWMIIPPARTPRQKLQMNGIPVNIDTVGQAVMAENSPKDTNYETSNFLSSMLSILGKSIIGVVGVVCALGMFFCAIGFICVTTGLIAWYATSSQLVLESFNISPVDVGIMAAWAIDSSLLLGFFILGFITWACSTAIFNLKNPSKTFVITFCISIVMLIATTIILALIAAA